MKRQYIEPSISKNELQDIIDWLKDDTIVILCNNIFEYRIFYKNEDVIKDLTNRIVVVYVKTVPSVLDPGEWDWYIKEDGNLETNDVQVVSELLKIISNNEPNVFKYTS